MNTRTDRVEQSPEIQRLVDQVERRQLHKGSAFSDPRAWLINWLSTPDEDLNGRRPSYFLQDADWDLILVGLLIRKQTRSAWGKPTQVGALEDEACASRRHLHSV